MTYNWNEMSPRERDELVAEKVMNFEEDKHFFVDSNYLYRFQKRWSPTRKIADAWEVVEKLDLKQFSLTYEVGVYFKWYASAGPKGNAYSDYASEAICLAALRAVGVDV